MIYYNYLCFFTLVKKEINIGNISIYPNNTLLDQIIREKWLDYERGK